MIDKSGTLEYYKEEITLLRAENAELRKDAERWRFFRKADWADWNSVFRVEHGGLPLPDLLDKATDAAMAYDEGEKK